MNRRQMNERIDLLSLPAAERAHFCREIKAALKKRVAEAKLPVADDTIGVDRTILDASKSNPINDAQKSSVSPQKTSALDSLLKRVW